MKQQTRYLILLILPLLLCGMGPMVRSALGPSWQTGYDPDYTYLLNGVQLARGDKAYYSDHPGTTLHLFNAAAISAIHLCTGSGSIAQDVLDAPEFYVRCLNLAILAVSAAAVYAAAALVVLRTGVLAYGLFLQMGVFLSMAAIEASPRVTPEPALVGLTLLTAALVVTADPAASRKERLLTALFAGVLGGLGIGLKLTFGPILLVALVGLPGWRERVLSSVATVLVFCALVFSPFVNRTGWYILGFARDIIQHTGQYGTGERGVFTLSTLVGNVRSWLALILSQEWPGAVVMLGSAAALAWYAKTRLHQPELGEDRRRALLLLAVLAAQGAQLVMVLKMPSPEGRYLVPMLSLLGVNVVLALDMLLPGAPEARKTAQRRALTAAIAVLCLVQAPRCVVYCARLATTRDARQAAVEKVNAACEGARVIEFGGALTPQNALLFGSDWSSRKLARELTEKYPWYLRFDLSSGLLRRFGWPIDPAAALAGNGQLLLRGGHAARVADSPWTTPLLKTDHECLYRLDPGIIPVLAAARPDAGDSGGPDSGQAEEPARYTP